MFNLLIDSLKNLFAKPQTISYPKNEIIKNKSYRGLIEYNEEHCIFCDKCEKVCPADAIIFTQELNGDKKYHYNAHLCIYCGECVRECPKINEALWQSNIKPEIAVKDDNINIYWTQLQKDAKESRIAYKTAKKEKKIKETT